jgi:hypothetical protein
MNPKMILSNERYYIRALDFASAANPYRIFELRGQPRGRARLGALLATKIARRDDPLGQAHVIESLAQMVALPIPAAQVEAAS